MESEGRAVASPIKSVATTLWVLAGKAVKGKNVTGPLNPLHDQLPRYNNENHVPGSINARKNLQSNANLTIAQGTPIHDYVGQSSVQYHHHSHIDWNNRLPQVGRHPCQDTGWSAPVACLTAVAVHGCCHYITDWQDGSLHMQRCYIEETIDAGPGYEASGSDSMRGKEWDAQKTSHLFKFFKISSIALAWINYYQGEEIQPSGIRNISQLTDTPKW